MKGTHSRMRPLHSLSYANCSGVGVFLVTPAAGHSVGHAIDDRLVVGDFLLPGCFSTRHHRQSSADFDNQRADFTEHVVGHLRDGSIAYLQAVCLEKSQRGRQQAQGGIVVSHGSRLGVTSALVVETGHSAQKLRERFLGGDF